MFFFSLKDLVVPVEAEWMMDYGNRLVVSCFCFLGARLDGEDGLGPCFFHAVWVSTALVLDDNKNDFIGTFCMPSDVSYEM